MLVFILRPNLFFVYDIKILCIYVYIMLFFVLYATTKKSRFTTLKLKFFGVLYENGAPAANIRRVGTVSK